MQPALLLYAVPGFVILLIAEIVLTQRMHKEMYEVKDTASSLAMGIGNLISGLFTKAVIFAIFTFIYQFRVITLPWDAWWVWGLLFFADDFSYYWFHRLSHGVRFFWASHVVHHSSQKYNLGTALRQTWTGNATGTFIFWTWMPFVGFEPWMVMTMQAISLIYQFWIHTEMIDRMPRWFEFIFNTPSHHRVHHSSDAKYLDLNHAGILIIWDRMFGTFQVEEEHPTYGLTKNISTFNPVKIAFHEWGDMFKDVVKPGSLRQKWMYVFGPPGWSHDGSRKTSAQVRAEWKAVKEEIAKTSTVR